MLRHGCVQVVTVQQLEQGWDIVLWSHEKLLQDAMAPFESPLVDDKFQVHLVVDVLERVSIEGCFERSGWSL